MAPSCIIAIPAGPLKVAFKGDPCKVSGVADDSPVFGLCKIGYKFDELILSDGSVLTGLNTYDLVAALNESSGEVGRRMKFEMLLPSSSTVTLAPGPSGLTIEEVYGKPTITRIEHFSPLKKELRVGMVVNSVKLVDGYQIMGGTASEITSLLEAAQTDPKRTLHLVSPEEPLDPRQIILPKTKKIELPEGTTPELQFVLAGQDTAKIQSVEAGSPVRGLRPGYFVEKLELAEGHSFSGMDGPALTHVIDKTSNSSGRVIYLKNPEFFKPPSEALTKVMLPSDVTMDECGIRASGSPAKITKVESGPLFGLVSPGYYVRNFGWQDGTSFGNLSAHELEEVFADSVGLEGRYLECSYGKAAPTSVVTLTLGPGPVGGIFKGSPPMLTRMKEGSMLSGEVEQGYVADTLLLPNGTKYYQMDTMEFTSALKGSADLDGRVVRFIDPKVVALTPKPFDASTNGPEMCDYKAVSLPTGPIGVTFKGKKRAHVSKVKATSPLYRDLPTGMGVDTITVNKRVFMEMNATEVADLVKSTSEQPGRVMTVRHPESSEFQRIPERLEVVLPAGKLYCTFTSNPPVAKSFKPESTIASYIPPSMYVDSFMMPDGYTQSGFNTRELVALLGYTSSEEGRTLVLKKKTVERTPKQEIFPEEKEIDLGTGKLGISFKGRKNARLSRVHEGSSLMGKAYVGMIVDQIIIPGSSSFAGMTAKEAARVLVETANVGGRKIVLKAPGAALNARNIPDDASIAGSSQDMSAAFSTSSSFSGVSRRL